ncbi:hypothetical protein CYMTET_51765 [Cymbomonas tetramitiformis]|uniref:Uncharacterized protein n=1 Tax=Cymbomonas tetramitiformis TaxID=36881 RepID=A0AAE0BKF0_9CHLO|nr:hypothetical protein CYMTET_51765 [Cymbomonas tetramitiformis]
MVAELLRDSSADHVRDGKVNPQAEATIIRSVLILLKTLINLRDLYVQLCKRLIFFWFYLCILSLHFNAQDSFTTVSSITERVLPPLRGVDFMDWFKTTVCPFLSSSSFCFVTQSPGGHWTMMLAKWLDALPTAPASEVAQRSVITINP